MYDFRHLNDFRQLSGQLLHYVSLDRYDLYRFEKKTITRNCFCSCCFEKKITDIIFKIPIGPAESSIVSLKMHCKTSCFSIIVLTLGR